MKKETNHKLGVIVPYRNRYRHLIHFKEAITTYLDTKGIDYEIIIVEQDDASAFNRGKLLNVGVLKAIRLGCDYVVLHDVDMLPMSVDYSYAPEPTHLITRYHKNEQHLNIPFEKYFGGVTLFPIEQFEQINGYSNEYWGWGFEDDDLFHRVLKGSLPVETTKIPNYPSSTGCLKFNGESSFIEATNNINFNRSFTIHISLNLEKLILDHEKESDRYTIFSIPGYDFNVFYSSFKRYNVEIFDSETEIHTINSHIVEPKQTKLTLTWDAKNKNLTFYIDDLVVNHIKIENGLYKYNRSKYFYLGCSNRNDDAHNPVTYMKGSIDTFAAFDKCLNRSDIHSLVKNNTLGLTQDFGNYNAGDSLTTYFDFKHIKHYQILDLSGNNNKGIITDCWIESTDFDSFKYESTPIRRPGVVKLLEHEDEGYVNNAWKDKMTRYNQLRLTNEVLTGGRSFKDDGLSTCIYKLHGETKEGRITTLNVGI